MSDPLAPTWYHCLDCGMRTSTYGPTGPMMTNQCGYCGATAPSLAPWGENDGGDDEG